METMIQPKVTGYLQLIEAEVALSHRTMGWRMSTLHAAGIKLV